MQYEIETIPEGFTTEGTIGRRYLARIIDVFCVVVLGGSLAMPLQFVLVRIPSLQSLEPVFFWATLVTVWILYFALAEASSWQATPGKRLLQLRVATTLGERITLVQSTLRTLVRDVAFGALSALVPGLGLLLLIAQLGVLALTSQLIHDRLSGTVVLVPRQPNQLKLTAS